MDSTLYRSQDSTRQDRFVDAVLGYKVGGTFVDVGCSHYETINNTFFFERFREWSGVGIDIEEKYRDGWLLNRKRSSFVRADATSINYRKLFDDCGFLGTVDYLSIDLEPPQLSLLALAEVLQSGRRFSVITFETDWYRQRETQAPSRRLLLDSGYLLAKEGVQDDFWVSEELQEMLDSE